MNHTFTGPRALFDYLRPGSCGPTPLIELPPSLNPFTKDSVRIFIKMAGQVPLGNIKSVPSWSMLESLSLSKRSSTHHLAEYSSGNTALSLTLLSRHFGIANMHALIAPDVPAYKQQILRLAGTHLIMTDGPASPGVYDTVGGIHNATLMGKKKGWHSFNQYTSPENPRGSETYVAREIWKQLGDSVSVTVSSIGTSGTIVGLGSYLKKKKPSMKLVGASIKTGSSIPGPRGEVAIKKLCFPWQRIVDEEIPVTTKPAYALALKLIRLGLLVGPSTGMQLAAVHEYLRSQKKKGALNELRNHSGTIDVVFLACDTMYPYVQEFFDVLPESRFPAIKKWLP